MRGWGRLSGEVGGSATVGSGTVPEGEKGVGRRIPALREAFLGGLGPTAGRDFVAYLQALDPAVKRQGTAWLQAIVDAVEETALSLLTSSQS